MRERSILVLTTGSGIFGIFFATTLALYVDELLGARVRATVNSQTLVQVLAPLIVVSWAGWFSFVYSFWFWTVLEASRTTYSHELGPFFGRVFNNLSTYGLLVLPIFVWLTNEVLEELLVIGTSQRVEHMLLTLTMWVIVTFIVGLGLRSRNVFG